MTTATDEGDDVQGHAIPIGVAFVAYSTGLILGAAIASAPVPAPSQPVNIPVEPERIR